MYFDSFTLVALMTVAILVLAAVRVCRRNDGGRVCGDLIAWEARRARRRGRRRD